MSANTTSGFEAVQNMECDVEVPVNIANTIDRIRDNYDDLPTGVVRELIQNSVDGRVENMYRDGSPIDSLDGLKIGFTITKNASEPNTMEIIDNAGGMPKSTLKNNLVGVNTPSGGKESGDMNGAYGQGFYMIISPCSGQTYVQTRHINHTYSIGVNGSGLTTSVKTDGVSAFPQDEDGTYILCSGLHDSSMQELADFSAFRDRVLDSFWLLFSKFDVTISHTVVEEDGTTTENTITDAPIDLDEYQNDIVHHRDDFPEMGVSGREGQLTELTLYHTKNMSEEELEFIDGICAVKGSSKTGPVMKVMSYTPQLPPIANDDMIGVANVSGMCPQYEKNDHFGIIRTAKEACGWTSEARKAYEENFDSVGSEDAQQIESDVVMNVNETFSAVDEDEMISDSFDFSGPNNSNSSSEQNTSSPSSARVRGMVGDYGNKFDVGEEVLFEVNVLVPESSDASNWRIETDLTGPVSASHTKMVTLLPGSSDTFQFGNSVLPEEGEYEFTVKLYNEEDDGFTLSLDDNEPEPVSKSSYTFYVGDVEVDTSVSVSSNDSNTPELLTDIVLFADPDRNWRAEVEVGREEGFTANVNIGRIEMKDIAKGGSSDNVVNSRAEKATEWVLEELAGEIAKRSVESDEFSKVRAEQRRIADELTNAYQQNN